MCILLYLFVSMICVLVVAENLKFDDKHSFLILENPQGHTNQKEIILVSLSDPMPDLR